MTRDEIEALAERVEEGIQTLEDEQEASWALRYYAALLGEDVTLSERLKVVRNLERDLASQKTLGWRRMQNQKAELRRTQILCRELEEKNAKQKQLLDAVVSEEAHERWVEGRINAVRDPLQQQISWLRSVLKEAQRLHLSWASRTGHVDSELVALLRDALAAPAPPSSWIEAHELEIALLKRQLACECGGSGLVGSGLCQCGMPMEDHTGYNGAPLEGHAPLEAAEPCAKCHEANLRISAADEMIERAKEMREAGNHGSAAILEIEAEKMKRKVAENG